MGGIAPKIIKVVADPAHQRDAFLGIEDRQETRLEPWKRRAFRQRRNAFGIALANPVEGLRAANILQPQKRVGREIGGEWLGG